MMEPDTVYIDIRTCDLTLSQVMARIVTLQAEHPEQEIFMDGDAYAVVGRRRMEALDFIVSLKALDVSFTAINIPEAVHDA